MRDRTNTMQGHFSKKNQMGEAINTLATIQKFSIDN